MWTVLSLIRAFIYSNLISCQDFITSRFFTAHHKFLTFQLCVLPFGLSSAAFVFTKNFKALLKSRRSKGIPIVIFLDDGLGGGVDPVSAKINGLVVPIEVRLCFQWGQVTVGVHTDNYLVSRQLMSELLRIAFPQLRDLVYLQALHARSCRVHSKHCRPDYFPLKLFGHVARVTTRFLFSEINSAVSCDGKVLLTQDVISEIDFWRQCPHPKWQSILGQSLFLSRLSFLMLLTLLVMRFARAGDLLTIGCVPPDSASLLESLGIWSCAKPEGPW